MAKTKGRLNKARIAVVFIITGLWIFALTRIYPIFLILTSALKTNRELAVNPFGLPQKYTLEHFIAALEKMNYARSMFNSLFIAFMSAFFLVLFTATAAYAIIRRNNRFYNFLSLYFLVGLIIPGQMLMIPLYKFMNILHLTNTYHGIIVIYISQCSFALFLFSGFIKTVPLEIEEAATIDGCGLFRKFRTVVFPLLKPAIATISVLSFFHIYNDFLTPLLYLQKKDLKTIVLQMFSFQGEFFNDWSAIFAAVLIIVYPMILVYIKAQDFIISGITAGAVKG